MTDTFITQCPHCQTSFRLKHSQLTAAHGSVRCGACLQVFNAASQINQLSALSNPSVSANDEPVLTTAAPDDSDSFLEQANTGSDTFTAEPTDFTNSLLFHDDMDLTDLDDLDLDAELARLEQEEQLEQSAANAGALNTDSDDDWSDDMLAEAAVPPLASTPPQETATEATLTQPDGLASTATKHSRHQDPHTTQLTADTAEIAAAVSMTAQRHYANEPIRLNWRPKKKPWKRWLAWSALNLLAVLLLVGQYTHHNFTQLARQDSTRPWLEVLCPLIDCQLPDKVDVQRIKSSNLLVRSHPEFSGALLVDAIIYNRASFAQPFPLLELTFSDQHNQLIAKRSFTPAEYLAGELAGQTQMPPQTPIHIALEVLEPSGGVMSYQLSFISPE